MTRRYADHRRAWLAGFALVALGVMGWLGWRTINRHAFAVSSIPLPPALERWPAGLRDDVDRGEQLAHSYFHSETGLAALGGLYHINGFYNEAIQCYQGLQVLQPGEARWPHLLATILGGFGRLDEALPLYQRAAALAPGYLPARLQLGNALLKANQTPAAVRAYSAALERDPGNQYALLGLAKCDLAVNDWDKARDHLQQAMQSHADFVAALSLMVTVSEHFGDMAAATSLRASVGTRQPIDLPDPWLDSLYDDCYDPYRLSVAAAVANQTGNAVTGRRWLERAIALDPTNHSYLRELSKMYFQAHDYPLALQYLKKAVTVGPEDSDAWALLVDLFTTLGDPAASERTLASGLVNCPQSAALHYTHGHRLSAAGKYDEAIAELRVSKKLRPAEPATYVDLAVIDFRLGRPDDAVAELKEALLFQPGNPLALEVLARYAIGAGDEVAARHWLSQLRLQPRVAVDDLKFIVDEYQHRFGNAP